MNIINATSIAGWIHEYNYNWNAHNSSLEGAMKLKFASFCSSLNALSNGMIFKTIKECLLECGGLLS